MKKSEVGGQKYRLENSSGICSFIRRRTRCAFCLYDMRVCPLSLSLQGGNKAWIENQVNQVKWFVVQKLQAFARLLIHMKTQ